MQHFSSLWAMEMLDLQYLLSHLKPFWIFLNISTEQDKRHTHDIIIHGGKGRNYGRTAYYAGIGPCRS